MMADLPITPERIQALLDELAATKERLAEAEETLSAIRNGEIDGVVVAGPQGDQVFTLKGADHAYRVMMEAMEEGAVTLSADGTILFCNRRFASMLRLPHAQVLGTPFSRFLSPESRQHFTCQAGACRDYASRGEVTLVAGDGTLVPVSLACSALPDEETESLCLVATDLTARYAAEAEIRELNQTLEARVEARTAELAQANAALRVSEERLSLAISASRAMVYDLDTRMNRIQSLTGVETLIGTTPSEAELTLAWWDARIDPDDLLRLRKTLKSSLSHPAQHYLEYRIRHADGKWLNVADHATVVCDDSGAPIRVVGSVVDITARKQAEIERERLLERMNSFIHMVSHDLRAPLTIMNGHAELLQDDVQHDNPMLHLCTDAIRRSVSRMNVMIDDLVDAARLEGGQMPLAQQPMLPAEYLPAFVARNAKVLDADRIHCDIPGDLAPMLADEARLERILTNLLSNAQKYSAPGTPIRVQARQTGAEVTISIIDQGQGIHPDDIPHLFERFYRARGERRAEGIGLGLYITRLLVEAHGKPTETGTAQVGGRIWVDSEIGKGSTFNFTLPVA